jgi:NAD(P)-dependent dehydrogenase (short-subunit alcohol dehydrogenase family)
MRVADAVAPGAVWLVTGCSSGLGRALAEAIPAAGDRVVATARDVAAVRELASADPEHVLATALDVTDPDRIRAVVREAEERFGRIDVLVNNAGYGFRAAIEEAEDRDVQRLFATHVFGPLHAIQAVLPGMRARRTGAIVNISSIGARTAMPGSGYYAGAKAALETMTSALRKELAPLGIRALAVEPGAFRTDFSGRSLTESSAPIADYAETAGRRRRADEVEADGAQRGDPARAAAAIIDVVRAPTSPSLLLLGADAVELFERSRDALDAEVEDWRAVSVGTDLA